VIRPGSNKATNNDALYIRFKKNIRGKCAAKFTCARVLSCLHGEGLLWRGITAKVTSNDADLKWSCDYVKNYVSLLNEINIHLYDIIDIDTWGSPAKGLEVLFKRKYKGIVICTFCNPVPINPCKILAESYYGALYTKCKRKSVFGRDISNMFLDYLNKNGAFNIEGLFAKQKIYCKFEL